MKQKRSHRVISLLAGICLLLTLLPTAALAENEITISGGLNLTSVSQDTTYKTADGGTAEWVYEQKTLTLSGTGTITGNSGQKGITLPGDSKVVVETGADWTVIGAIAQAGIFSGGKLTVEVLQGGRLTATGGDEVAGLSGFGIDGSGIDLQNDGEIFAFGGKNDSGFHGGGIRSYDPGLTITGTGALRCKGGIFGIEVMREKKGGAGSLKIEGGTVLALAMDSAGDGIYTHGGTVSVAESASLTGVGKEEGIYSAISGGGEWYNITAAIVDEDKSGGLDLENVDDTTFYANVGGGTALWTPCTDANSYQNPNQLTLTDVHITGGSENIRLPKGYSEIRLSGENTLTGAPYGIFAQYNNGEQASRFDFYGDGSLTADSSQEAVHAYDSSAQGVGSNVYLHGSDADGVVLVAKAGADAGSAMGLDGTAVTEGYGVAYLPLGMKYFHMAYVTPGDNEYVLTVERGMGGGVYKAGDKITLASTLPADDFRCWADVSTYAPLAGVTFLSGTSAMSDAVEFEMPARNLFLQAMDSEYTPPSTGSSSGPSTYTVVYKGNYEGAPKDVRDSGHRAGAEVTAKPASTFAAPEGKAFAGWAESADGKAVYQAGDKFKMPAKTLNLYAVWRDAVPGLNKTDHIAYIQGYADGTVRPMGDITREEVAMIFYRLLDEPTRARYETDQHSYPDVAAGRWSNTAIATLTNADILRGYEDGTFRPEGRITRAEFAAVAARFDSEAYSGDDLFRDIAPHWARNEINRAANKGWVRGDGDGRFRPEDPITRAEAVTLVNRVLERAPETAADLLDGMKTFTDNMDTASWYYLALQEAANGHDYVRKADHIHETWTALTV